MEELKDKFQHIKGWGIDADPENEPTYPIKHYTGDDHKRLNWERPVQQEFSQEILMSIERPSRSAVVGETVPPKGLSGLLRRYAFKHSESEYGHWLPLLLADRINEWEGIFEDIVSGKIPNVFAEKGGKAAWTHNRQAVIKKMAFAVVAVGAIGGYLFFKRRK